MTVVLDHDRIGSGSEAGHIVAGCHAVTVERHGEIAYLTGAGIVQVCREIGWQYAPLRLGQMEVGDLVGIPFREGAVMHWSRPSWWPEDDAPQTSGGRISAGLEQIRRLVQVDQKPIGRTPRSNLATYTGLFDHVRKLFAA